MRNQGGNLFRLMSGEEQQRLIRNIVDAMREVPCFIQVHQIGHSLKADPA